MAARLHAVMCFAMAKLSLSGAILLFNQTWNAQKEEKCACPPGCTGWSQGSKKIRHLANLAPLWPET